MVKYLTELKEKSLVFNNIEEFNACKNKYGLFGFDGRPIKISIHTDDIFEAARMKDIKGDIYIILKPGDLEKLSNVVPDENLDTSKYQKIMECLTINDIAIENNKIVNTLLKVMPNYNLSDELLDFAIKCNKYITMEAIKENYLIDTSTHPINVLRLILNGKHYKSVLAKTRSMYNDKAIRTSMLNHIKTSLDKRYKYSSEREQYDTLGYINKNDLIRLYVALNKISSIDIAFEAYKRSKNEYR